jgi:DNA-binding response OmpR family regulator/DNA-binding CsgD family transcriptional regulator
MKPSLATPVATWANRDDRADPQVVLVVDDVPDNLAVLHDALEEAGYMVLVATQGASALQRADEAQPDVILLDALMPGMDGFEVARRLKAQPRTQAIPVIFMTGLTDTEHLVAAMQAGAVDYVTKPIRPPEVLARMQVHLTHARERRQARNALDAFGYASLTVRERDGRVLWATPLARELLARYFGPDAQALPVRDEVEQQLAPLAVRDWLHRALAEMRATRRALRTDPAGPPNTEPPRLVVERASGTLSLRLHRQTSDADTLDRQTDSAHDEGEWMVVMREASDAAVIQSLALAFRLTAREAEVMVWVVRGKINRDIADIVGSSPATVKKHLERVFAKLGVETRTAAAALVMQRIRQLHPQFEA